MPLIQNPAPYSPSYLSPTTASRNRTVATGSNSPTSRSDHTTRTRVTIRRLLHEPFDDQQPEVIQQGTELAPAIVLSCPDTSSTSAEESVNTVSTPAPQTLHRSRFTIYASTRLPVRTSLTASLASRGSAQEARSPSPRPSTAAWYSQDRRRLTRTGGGNSQGHNDLPLQASYRLCVPGRKKTKFARG
jgi:hypothetical protein